MDFDEIVVKESPGLCRCCLSEGCYKDLSTEYTWMNDTEIYADMLLDCFDISISQHNEGPNGPNRLICEVCITRLRDACNFKKQVLDSEKKFVDMVGRGEFAKILTVYSADLKTEEMESVPDAEIEYLEDDIDYSEELQNESAVEEEIVEPAPAKAKRGRPKKGTTLAKKAKLKVAKSEEKAKSSKTVTKDEHTPFPDGRCPSEKKTKNLQTLFKHTTVLPFNWLGEFVCVYCNRHYKEHGAFTKHIKSHGFRFTNDLKTCLKDKHGKIKVDVSDITCEICYECFTNCQEIINHLIKQHDMNLEGVVSSLLEYDLINLRCSYCKRLFSCFEHLDSHVVEWHLKDNFACNYCKEIYAKKSYLASHLSECHQVARHPCNQCVETFKTEIALRVHKTKFHCIKCSYCSSVFSTHLLLLKHIKQYHLNTRSILSAYCYKIFDTSINLSKHIDRSELKHLTQSSERSGPKVMELIADSRGAFRPKLDTHKIRENILCVLNMSTAVPFKYFHKFACFYCSKTFPGYEELKEHTVEEHPICELNAMYMKNLKGARIRIKVDVTTLKCKICCEPMASLDILVDHLIEAHAANYDKSVTCFEAFRISKDSIPCPYCDKVFRYFILVLKHINVEHSENNSICDYCGQAFKTINHLKIHIGNTHVGSKCDICGIKVKNAFYLERHQAKSHNTKKYKCSQCSETFISQYRMQRHLIQAHDTGHKCTYCGKLFTRNSFMKNHIRRTHLKEKNVPCTVCNEKFFDSCLLKLHMVRHLGERKFCCKICGKSYLRRKNLNYHMGTHKKHGNI